MPYPQRGGKYAHTPKTTPTRTYSAPNAPYRIAAVRYGNKAKSDRTEAGILHKPPAISFDYHVLSEVTADGCEIVEVFITDTNTTYSVSIADFWKYGKIQTRFGKQVVLSLRYWTVKGQAQQPEPQAELEAQPEAAQLGLFGGA